MRIDQVLVGAREGDAITQIAFNLRSVFNRFGGSDVFARHLDPSVAGMVRSIDAFADTVGPGDVVAFHVSIGDDVVWDEVAKHPGRVWVIYHNITPSSFFADRPAFAAHLDQGRAQLRDLAPRIDRMLAVSAHNRDDLAAMGFDDVLLVPPMLEPDRLKRLPSDPAFGREIRRRAPGPVVLFVGQMLPHKRPDLLVGALHLLLAHHRPDATLVLAGHQPSPDYAEQVARFAAGLGIADRVWITGGVPDSQLAELYRHADVVTTASQHEGICLPIVEAMAMSVPVVASSHGAIPDTLGGAGIVVDEDCPAAYAEALAVALEPATRRSLIPAGRARARALSLAASEPAMIDLTAELLASS